MPGFVRPVVAASWRRSATAGASASGNRLPPVPVGPGELEARRTGHPLRRVLPVFDSLLGEPAEDGEHIFAVGDADGTLLWVRGHRPVLARAERMNFVEGAVWSEAQAGTNAPGTALAVAAPVQVSEGEHYNEVVRPWSCAAAPVRDLRSGLVLGVIDVTGGERVAGPHVLALVRAVARVAENELVRCGPPVPGAGLRALGRDCAVMTIGGESHVLSPRHSELVVILALARGGLTAERLAVELSETDLAVSTVRAEVTRLRAVLGGELLESRPYALRLSSGADFLTVGELLAAGRVHQAMSVYAGPLLPSSTAPAVVEHRTALEQQLRGAVVASGDVTLLRRWVGTEWGAPDLAVWQALAAHLPPGSAARGAAAARANGLSAEYGLPRAAWSQRSRS